jgi:hypothetical protein
LLRKEARLIEIFENDRGNGRFGHRVGTWGLCATQGGCGPSCAKRRKIDPLPGNLLGYLAQKARSFSAWPFSIGTNEFCFYRPVEFTVEDMPPTICHVPCVRVHVCVIRSLSALISAPVLFAHVALTR